MDHEQEGGMMGVHKIELIVDDDDYRDINAAITRRQQFRDGKAALLPDGDGSLAGRRLVGEICRGWIEMLSMRFDQLPGDEWKDGQ